MNQDDYQHQYHFQRQRMHQQMDPTFAPILVIGDLVQLIKSSGVVNVEVIGTYPLLSHRHDFGTLTPGTNSLDQECTHLDQQTGILAQIRFIVRNGFDLSYEIPSGVAIAVTDNSVRGTRTADWRIGPWDSNDTFEERQALWAGSELLILEDERPRFNLYPYGGSTGLPVAAHVDFYGIAYALAPTKGEPTHNLWVNSRPAGRDLTQ